MAKKVLILSLLAVFSGLLNAQESILSSSVLLPAREIRLQESYPLLIELDILEEWHINSDKPLEEFLIPTEVSFAEESGVSFGRIQFSRPELRKFTFSETEMSVFEGITYIKSSLTVSPEFTADQLVIKGTVYYQACNDYSCLAPDEQVFTLTVPVLREGNETMVNQGIFDRVLPQFEQDVPDPGTAQDEFADVIRKSSVFYVLLFIYLGGLALNLTPCVYPLIPITISYFGGQGQASKSQLVIRAVLYVLGMSVTYSLLGVAAALTGGLLGSALQNPVVLIFVALVMIALALSMFGVYEIRVPQSLALIGSKNRAGLIGTFLMGLTVGLIAAPCIGPFVLGLLTYVGEIGDPVLGFWMFFVLALGLGTPFIFLGIFSGAISYLPRSGSWMVWVRNLFGFVLLGMAIYFLEPLFPSTNLYIYTLALLVIVAGIYLALIDTNRGGRGFQTVRLSTGLIFLLLGVYLFLPGKQKDTETIDWQAYDHTILLGAQSQGKPVIIDFYADWCIPCKELDLYTFSDERVATKAEKFVMLKADLTNFQSRDVSDLRERFSIQGVPTIIFLDKSGKEISAVRLVGFEDAESFLGRMERVLESM